MAKVIKTDLELANDRIKELKGLLEYNEEIILKKILDKSDFYESVKAEVDSYRKYQKNIDKFTKIVDKIYSIRDELLDIAEVEMPQLYEDFVKDVYDEDPYESLVFIRAFVREITKE